MRTDHLASPGVVEHYASVAAYFLFVVYHFVFKITYQLFVPAQVATFTYFSV